ncbi:MAG: DUF5103 domain-containing protein [Flavobacteriaceae bacterium]|jgi:hypothetical protein|nr:DUF5103 domain-containing protein [Flavobacteriaceae bacterium]
MNKHFLFFWLLIVSCLISFQQVYAQNNNLTDAEYIKTVVLKSENANSFAPIFRLGEPFSLSFDDVEADEKDYYYLIEHFDYHWNKSKIAENEYVIGFHKNRIRNYENSFNTLQYYTHYIVNFPNEKTQITQSGNYLLSVLDENDQIVFSRKLVVVNPKTEVGVTIHRTRAIETIAEQQTVQFSINHSNLSINNPSEEIKVVVIQNNNWNTAVKNLKPQYFRMNQLIYKYDLETSFWGGNEYLNFDNKIIRNTSLNISKVYLGDDIFYTYLFTDEERHKKPYTYFPDINGNFLVRNLEGENAALDADYSWIHFSLKTDKQYANKDIYVYGNFNNWQFSSINKMKYNAITGLYELPILLKQGFYNYRYATIDHLNHKEKLNDSEIDGSFFQTENEYTVLVYYRKTGARFDEVIGVGNAHSDVIKQ